ncbi:TPA: hypothetical protein JBC15_15200 [Legionella pneumophila subsp. pneumophila]|uniref:hypothetical protein n=1 Tax=Legionella pneumophila TaxID=446 RepID=UPI0007709943|nr:hypothetical protein [Legionella pneumophila]HAT9215387.1 hypothetical protein [Legionella pneumophila subsp. pneumophila]CZJ14014.1 Uncharacterised protein [Legionella pneumophila]HAT9262343.1 hypothetical protein [Legionella pneumophila subsp. pneumophila]HAT9283609.1 hypothetical protein [Legionella pneumophila subsp. pneumophila]HAT9289870.1 hypothetical protein [Legionella pneumophila subsp. pneumophila]
MSASNEILSRAEIYILLSIMSSQPESGRGVLKTIITDNLRSTGDSDFLNFIDFTVNLNIDHLVVKQLIERSNDFIDPAYAITSAGANWLFTNEHRLKELLSLEVKTSNSHLNLIES